MKKALILVSVVFLFICCDRTQYSKESYTKTRVKRIVSNKVYKTDNKETVPVKGNSLSQSTSDIQYHIIIASTTNKKTALAIATSYKNRGYNAKLIQSVNNRFRVSIDSFKTKDEACKAKIQYKIKLKKEGVWILPF